MALNKRIHFKKSDSPTTLIYYVSLTQYRSLTICNLEKKEYPYYLYGTDVLIAVNRANVNVSSDLNS